MPIFNANRQIWRDDLAPPHIRVLVTRKLWDDVVIAKRFIKSWTDDSGEEYDDDEISYWMPLPHPKLEGKL